MSYNSHIHQNQRAKVKQISRYLQWSPVSTACRGVHPLQRHHLRHIANCLLVNLGAAKRSTAVKFLSRSWNFGLGVHTKNATSLLPPGRKGRSQLGKSIGNSHRMCRPRMSVRHFFQFLCSFDRTIMNYWNFKFGIPVALCHRGNSHILGPPISSIPVPRLNLAKMLRPTDASCLRRFSR